MKRKPKKGFTLVELLAVIVILAIILVIAVPKVMDIINDAKKGTLESTAKMIANAAEKQKVQNTVLGKNETITCDDVAKINKGDYASCSINFENNTAKVTIEGSGKFENLWVCSGTKTDAEAVEGSCDGSSGSEESGMCLIDTYDRTYKINVDNCVTHLKSVFEEYWEDEVTDEEIRESCEREEFDTDNSIHDYIRWFIEERYTTKEELIEKGVYELDTEEHICIREETPANCFEYKIVKNRRIKNVDSCVAYLKDRIISNVFDNYGYEITESHVRELCQERNSYYVYEEDGEVYNERISTGEFDGGDDVPIYSFINKFIEEDALSTQELIDNNVLNSDITREIMITGYDVYGCGFDSLVIPSTINGLEVTQIQELAFSGSYKYRDYYDEYNTLYSLSPKVVKTPSTVYKIGRLSFFPNSWDEEEYNFEIEYKNKIYVELGNPNAVIGECAFGVNNNILNHNLPDTYECSGSE